MKPGESHYRVSASRSGEPTLQVTGSDGAQVQIHSRYRPAEEGRRQLASFERRDAAVIVVYGLGLGYHVAAMLDKLDGPDGPLVIVIEPLAELAAAAAACEAGRKALAGCILLAGDDLETTMAGLREALAGNLGEEWLVFRHTPSIQARPSFYQAVTERLGAFWREGLSALAGMSGWRDLRRHNLLRNIGHYLRRPGVSELFGAFSGATLFVVGAGPSLDKNAQLLGQVGNRGLIIAADTVLGPLQAAGAEPHLIISTDPQPLKAGQIRGLDRAETVHAISPEASPALFESAASSMVFQTHHPLLRYLARYAPRGELDVGCCASHAAFNLGLALGAKQVVLVGQDLALTGGRDYCRQAERGINRYHRFERAAGYFGGLTITDPALQVARTHFEQQIAESGVSVRNATEGGARIRGADPVKLREAIRALPTGELPVEQALRRALETPPCIDRKLTKGLARLRQALHAVERETAAAPSAELLDKLKAIEPAFSLLAEECLPEMVRCGKDEGARQRTARNAFRRSAAQWIELLEDPCLQTEAIFLSADHLPAERLASR